MKKTKLPNDVCQRAKMIMELATDTIEIPPTKQPAYMAAIGQKGGLKGGPARAAVLSKKRRKEIGKLGAAARWGKKG